MGNKGEGQMLGRKLETNLVHPHCVSRLFSRENPANVAAPNHNGGSMSHCIRWKNAGSLSFSRSLYRNDRTQVFDPFDRKGFSILLAAGLFQLMA